MSGPGLPGDEGLDRLVGWRWARSNVRPHHLPPRRSPFPTPRTAARVPRAYRRPEWHAFLRAAGLTVMEEETIAAGAGSPADRLILIRAEKD
ncbi:MAG TPA: hypothetical protein VMO81_00235 [Aestuariivirgaceae bacterium]|nr:hypothetical protein [Aestuariivirgaceae bacterium]